MNKKFVAALLSVAVVSGVFSTSAFAAREAGDWIFRVGMTNIDPKQGNGELEAPVPGLPIDVDDDTQVSFTGAYMFTPNLGVELLASLPFEHDIFVAGVNVGSTQHLPPTLNLQWYFNPQGQFQPYVGAGVNYTTFFSEEWNLQNLDPSLAGVNPSLDDSWGYDLQVGVDFEIAENLLVNFDVRYIDIDSDLKLNGNTLAKVEIDPLTVGVSLGWKF
jgi:outer membrane protein